MYFESIGIITKTCNELVDGVYFFGYTVEVFEGLLKTANHSTADLFYQNTSS